MVDRVSLPTNQTNKGVKQTTSKAVPTSNTPLVIPTISSKHICADTISCQQHQLLAQIPSLNSTSNTINQKSPNFDSINSIAEETWANILHNDVRSDLNKSQKKQIRQKIYNVFESMKKAPILMLLTFSKMDRDSNMKEFSPQKIILPLLAKINIPRLFSSEIQKVPLSINNILILLYCANKLGVKIENDQEAYNKLLSVNTSKEQITPDIIHWMQDLGMSQEIKDKIISKLDLPLFDLTLMEKIRYTSVKFDSEEAILANISKYINKPISKDHILEQIKLISLYTQVKENGISGIYYVDDKMTGFFESTAHYLLNKLAIYLSKKPESLEQVLKEIPSRLQNELKTSIQATQSSATVEDDILSELLNEQETNASIKIVKIQNETELFYICNQYFIEKQQQDNDPQLMFLRNLVLDYVKDPSIQQKISQDTRLLTFPSGKSTMHDFIKKFMDIDIDKQSSGFLDKATKMFNRVMSGDFSSITRGLTIASSTLLGGSENNKSTLKHGAQINDLIITNSDLPKGVTLYTDVTNGALLIVGIQKDGGSVEFIYQPENNGSSLDTQIEATYGKKLGFSSIGPIVNASGQADGNIIYRGKWKNGRTIMSGRMDGYLLINNKNKAHLLNKNNITGADLSSIIDLNRYQLSLIEAYASERKNTQNKFRESGLNRNENIKLLQNELSQLKKLKTQLNLTAELINTPLFKLDITHNLDHAEYFWKIMESENISGFQATLLNDQGHSENRFHSNIADNRRAFIQFDDDNFAIVHTTQMMSLKDFSSYLSTITLDNHKVKFAINLDTGGFDSASLYQNGTPIRLSRDAESAGNRIVIFSSNNDIGEKEEI